MKGRTTLVLAIVFVGLLAYVLRFQRGETRKEHQIFGFGKERVAKLEFKYGGDEAEDTVVLQKQGESWQILEPIKAKGNTEDVERMVSDFAGMEFGTTFTKAEGAKLTNEITGLDKPEFVAQAWDARGKRLAKLAVGKPADVSGKAYARVNDDYCVALSTYSTDGLKKRADDLRDKSVVEIAEDADVDSVEVKYAGNLARVQRIDDEHWRLTKPIDAEGDGWECKDLLTGIKELKVEEFVEKDEAKTPADYGLDKPQLTATVTLKKGAKQVVKLGKKVSEDVARIYAATEGRDEIFEVSDDILGKLRKTAADLREKRLLDLANGDVESLEIVNAGLTVVVRRTGENEFELEKPKQAKCDFTRVDDILWRATDLRADEFVADNPKDLKRYGLDKPAATVTLRTKRESYVILLGKTRDGQVYAKRGDRPNVVLVRDDLLRELPRTAEDLIAKEGEEGKAEGGEE